MGCSTGYWGVWLGPGAGGWKEAMCMCMWILHTLRCCCVGLVLGKVRWSYYGTPNSILLADLPLHACSVLSSTCHANLPRHAPTTTLLTLIRPYPLVYHVSTHHVPSTTAERGHPPGPLQLKVQALKDHLSTQLLAATRPACQVHPLAQWILRLSKTDSLVESVQRCTAGSV